MISVAVLLLLALIPATEVIFAPSSANHRPRRDLGGLQTTTDQLHSAARITSAIYVHQGFQKGSISPADFGAEILRLGSNSISQIDEAGLNSGVQALQDLPSKIQDNAEVKTFEKYYFGLEGFLKPLEGIESLKDWPGKDDFKEDILKIKNGSFDVQLVTEITDSAQIWEANLKSARGVTVQDHDAGKGYLRDLLKKSKYLLSHANSPPQLPKVFHFKGHDGSASSSFAVLPRTADSIEALNTMLLTAIQGGPKRKMKENLDGLSDSATKIGTIKTSFIVVKGILDSRARPLYSPQYKLTAGFSEGQKDVDFVFKDLAMPWIQKMTDSSKLAAALEPLKGIGANSDSLQKLDSDYVENSDAVNQVMSLSETFLSAAANPDDFMKTSEVIYNCVENRGITKPVTSINTMEAHVKSLDQELAKANAKISSIGSNLKNQGLKDLLKKTVEIVEGYESKDAAGLQKVFDNINKELQNTDPIDGIKGDIKSLVKPLPGKSGDVEKEFQSIDDFVTSTATFEILFKCLRGVAGRDAFFSSIRALRTLRESNGKQEYTDTIRKTSDIAKTVISAKKDLKTIEDVGSSVKSSKNSELDLFTDMERHSLLIGGATRGVLRMRKVVEKKEDLKFVIQHLDLVRTKLGVSTVKRVKRSVTSNDQALLKTLLDGSLEAMLTSLDQFESSQTSSSPSKFSALASICTSASRVAGVKYDLREIAGALRRLSENAQDPAKSDLARMATILDSFASIGLDFAQHSQEFSGCDKSLNDLDVLFAKHSKTPSTVPPGNKQPSGSGSPGTDSPLTTPLLSETTSEMPEAIPLSYFEKNKVVITGVACYLGSIVLAAAVTWYVFNVYLAEEDEDDDDDDSCASDCSCGDESTDGENPVETPVDPVQPNTESRAEPEIRWSKRDAKSKKVAKKKKESEAETKKQK